MLKCAFIGRMHQFRTIDALLALALLHEKVISTMTVECKFAASGTSDALLCATVRL